MDSSQSGSFFPTNRDLKKKVSGSFLRKQIAPYDDTLRKRSERKAFKTFDNSYAANQNNYKRHALPHIPLNRLHGNLSEYLPGNNARECATSKEYTRTSIIRDRTNLEETVTQSVELDLRCCSAPQFDDQDMTLTSDATGFMDRPLAPHRPITASRGRLVPGRRRRLARSLRLVSRYLRRRAGGGEDMKTLASCLRDCHWWCVPALFC